MCPLIGLTLLGDGVPLPLCIGVMVATTLTAGITACPSLNDAISPLAVSVGRSSDSSSYVTSPSCPFFTSNVVLVPSVNVIV